MTSEDEVKVKETVKKRTTATVIADARNLNVTPATATGGRVDGPLIRKFRSEFEVRELRMLPDIAIRPKIE